MAIVMNISQVRAGLGARITQSAKDDGVAVLVGYTQEYAVYVHENLQATHKAPTKAKYLEDPLKRLGKELARIISTAIAAGATMIQALLLAGLRLQRESQLEVPVEFGHLKNSAFTRKE